MKVKHLFLLFTLFLSSRLVAQNPPTITAQPNTVLVGAEGKFDVAPDTALIQFNIAAQEDTAKAAYEHASRRADQIRQILRAQGIEPRAAEIGFFSLEPVYDWRTAKRRLVAYRVNASVSLKLKDFSKIGAIVQQLSDSDISENQTINYTLENMDGAKIKAVEDAYRRARANADAVARSGGRTLGEILYASVDTFERVGVITPIAPQQARRAQTEAAAAPTAEFSPQNVEVTAHLNAMFALK